MAEFVLVGGSADGDRISINDDREFYDVPVYSRPRMIVDAQTIRVERYRKVRWRDGNRNEISFFRAEGTIDAESLFLLLKRYPRRDKREIVTDDILTKSVRPHLNPEDLLVASDLLESHGFDNVSIVLRNLCKYMPVSVDSGT